MSPAWDAATRPKLFADAFGLRAVALNPNRRRPTGVPTGRGEGELTDDPLKTFGGYGVVKIPNFQKLLRYICENGFEHHVAVNPTRIAAGVQERCFDYLDGPVRRLGGAQVPMPYSLPLEKASIPTSEDIKRLIRAVVGKKTND